MGAPARAVPGIQRVARVIYVSSAMPQAIRLGCLAAPAVACTTARMCGRRATPRVRRRAIVLAAHKKVCHRV